MSSSDAVPALIVASLDLKLVRLLRAAMNGDGGGAVSGLGPAPTVIERRFRVEPEPHILPRRRIEPEPRIEPRQVIRPADRYEPGACDPCVPRVLPPLECYAPPPPPPACKRHVIEPPWKVLPWEQAPEYPRVERKIKVVIKPPDIVHKGSLIDFFI